MSIHAVSTRQLIGFTLTSGILSASLVAVGLIAKYSGELPEVRFDPISRSCVEVINYINGDAYTCDDVDVILRRYHLVEHTTVNTDIYTPDADVPANESTGDNESDTN